MSFYKAYELNVDNVLSKSSNSIVVQGNRMKDGLKVIIKKPNSVNYTSNLLESLKRDYQIAKSLYEVDQESFVEMIELFEDEKNGEMYLVEKYEDAIDVSKCLHRLYPRKCYSVNEFMSIAMKMAKCLKIVHENHIFHRDIKLSNFIMNQKTGDVKIIDFGMSVALSKKSDVVLNDKHMIGTLFYMSPEQTGRVSKSSDFRSDIYSLGICFFELLTGNVPFLGDISSVTHAHLTKKIPMIPDVPVVLNDIIGKMCKKDPMERYNSVDGVMNDLKQCIEMNYEKFDVAQRDGKAFRLSNKLYGRSNELQLLKSIIGSRTESERIPVVLISGSSGMGKSRLVKELINTESSKLCYGYGKFELFERNTPFRAFIQIMKMMMNDIVSTRKNEIIGDEESKRRCDITRDLKSKFDGNNIGRILYSLVPQIGSLIGKQKEFRLNDSIEQQQENISLAIIEYFKCFNTTDDPVILFVDDLQWIDDSSFQLLEKISKKGKTGHIVIIGTYRDNEVGETHPLRLLISELMTSNNNDDEIKTFIDIQLKHLDENNICELLCDSIMEHDGKLSIEEINVSFKSIQEISKIIYKKTLGCPFSVRELILSIYDDNLMVLNNGKLDRWTFNFNEIEKISVSSNTASLISKKIELESFQIKLILTIAACIGSTFNVRCLSDVYWRYVSTSAISSSEMIKHMDVIKISTVFTETMKIVEKSLLHINKNGWIVQSDNLGKYTFAHDQIQEACINAIDSFIAHQQEIIHAHIGCHYYKELKKCEFVNDDDDDDNVMDANITKNGDAFAMVNHLNISHKLPMMKLKRMEIVRMNMELINVSLANGACKEALAFVQCAMNIMFDEHEIFGLDPWKENHKDTFQLYLLAAKVFFLNAKIESSIEYYELLTIKSINKFEKLCTYRDYLKVMTADVQYDKAYDIMIESLRLISITKDLSFDDNEKAMAWIMTIKQETDDIFRKMDVYSLKNCDDQEILLLVDIVCEAIGPMLLSPKKIPCIIMIICVILLNVTLNYGLTPQAPLVMALVGWAYNGIFNDSKGSSMTKMAEKLLKESSGQLDGGSKNANLNIPATYFYLSVGSMYSDDHKQVIYYAEKSAKHSIINLEKVFGVFGISFYSTSLLFNGTYYPEYMKKLKFYREYVGNIGNIASVDILGSHVEFINRLTGVIDVYDPKFNVPNVKNIPGADSFLSNLEAILHYYFGEYSKSFEIFQKNESIKQNSMGINDYYERLFYYALTCTQLYNENKNVKYMDKAKEILEEFKLLASTSDHYLMPKYTLAISYFGHISDRHNDDKEKVDVIQELSLFEKLLDSSKILGNSMLVAITSEIIFEIVNTHKMIIPPMIFKMYEHEMFHNWKLMGVHGKIRHLQKKYVESTNIIPDHTDAHKSSHRFSIGTTNNTVTDERKGSSDFSTLRSSSMSSSVGFASSDSILSLDIASIMKLSQTLSSETTLNGLLENGLKVIIESMGAEKVLLFMMDKKKNQYLEAIVAVDNDKIIGHRKNIMDINETDSLMSNVLFELSMNTQKDVIINNVTTSEYKKYEYFKTDGGRDVKSVYFHPLIESGKYIGMLYFENKSLDGIFDNNKKNILKFISSQFVISYKNALFYEEMKSLNDSYGRFIPKEFLKQLKSYGWCKGNNEESMDNDEEVDIRSIENGDSVGRKMYIMFTDIRNFTNITEKMTAKESFSFINEILDYLSPIVKVNGGFIDKFLGDCIMAIFPRNDPMCPIQCGIDMTEALNRYNEKKYDKTPVKIGIGVHYGDVMIGTIGNRDRMDATVISDTVNTSSRIESMTKTLGTTFLITEDVIQNIMSIDDHMSFKRRYIGKFLLKGKQKPMKLYHVLTHDNRDVKFDAMDLEKKKLFDVGIEHFEKQEFDESMKCFDELRSHDKTSDYWYHLTQTYADLLNDKIHQLVWSGDVRLGKDGNVDVSKEFIDEICQ